MQNLKSLVLSISILLVTAEFCVSQTSGELNTQTSQVWNTAPWTITSGPGTFPTGGGVATLLAQLNTVVGVSPDLTSLTLTNPITLSGVNFQGPFRWRIQTGAGGSLALSASGATMNADLPDFGQRYMITSAMSGGGAVGLTKVGAGTLTLSATNSTYTGGTHISNGVLEVTSDGSLGATGAGNGVSFAGGVLRLSGSSFTTARAIDVSAGDGAIDSLVTGETTFNGAFTGANDLIVATTNGTVAFTADNTISGVVTLAARFILMNLSGANGAFRFASGYNFPGVFVNLDSSSANNNNRLSDTAPITTGFFGRISLTGNSAVSTTENAGPLNVAGTTSIIVNANTGNQPSLNFASINRQNNAPLFIAGSNLGDPPAPFVAQITSAAAPVPLVGGGGAPGSTNISILPWMTGLNTIGAIQGIRHVTYNPVTDRLRAISTAEYAGAFGGTATNNVRLTTSTAAPATTVNALVFAPPSPATLSGGPINVTSGSFIHSPTSNFFPAFSTVSTGLNFGAAEGIIHATSNLEISAPITGSGGLTISSNGNTVKLSGANTYTGPTNIFDGVVQVSEDIPNDGATPNPLGLSTSPIHLNPGAIFEVVGGAQRARDTAGGPIVIDRDISVADFIIAEFDLDPDPFPPSFILNTAPMGSTFRNISAQSAFLIDGGTNASSQLTVDGILSGVGPVTLSGFTALFGTNTLSGVVSVRPNAVVKVGSNQAFGTAAIRIEAGFGDTTIEAADASRTIPNSFDLKKTVTLGGSHDLKISASVHLGGSRTINVTNTAATTISGDVFGGSLRKEGIGTLILNWPTGNDYNGGTVVPAGTLLVSNTSGSGTGPGTNLVDIVGALGGNFTLAGFSEIRGLLKPGFSVGTANFGSNVFFANTAQSDLEFSGASVADKVKVAGLLTLDGIVRVLSTGYVAQPGDSFDLFDWGTVDASNFNPATDLDLTGASIAGGASWDISNFLVDGSIFATTSTLQATSAISRKTHGAAGSFDILMPLTGAPGIECRNSGGNHTLIVNFSRNVVSGSASLTSGTGSVSGSPTFAANKMTVNLTGVANAQKITVTLSNVTDNTAQVLPSATVDMILLVGDTTANKTVNASDVSQTKSRSGLTPTAANFRSDVTANGSINASDVSLVKVRSGTAVP